VQAEDKALVSNGSKLQRFIDLAQKGAKRLSLLLSLSLSLFPPFPPSPSVWEQQP
jgi:hypothetical protein